MPRTPFRTPLEDLIVTSGDIVRGEDDTTGSAVLVRGGNSSGPGNVGASLTFSGGSGSTTGTGGAVLVTAGAAGNMAAGATVTVQGSDAGGGVNVGGDVFLTAGVGAGGAAAGTVRVTNTALEFVQATAVPGGTLDASRGRLWVRDDVPNVLVFTDGAGNDAVLGAGGGASRIATSGIVTDDLRFFIDFNNQSSWEPNQATTWTDTIASLGGTATATTITDGHLNFDGADSVVDFGTLPSALEDVFAGGGTVVAWVRPESDGEGNFGRIVDTSQGTSTAGWSLYVRDESAGNVQYALQAGTTVGGPNTWETTDSYPLGAWTFVAITFDSDSVGTAPTIYINGTSVGVTTITDTGTGYGSDAGNDLLVGNRTGSDRTFDGDIEVAGLYDVTKTAAEVRDIYRAQSSRFGSVAAGISSGRAETVQVLGGTSGTASVPGGDVTVTAGSNASGVGTGRGGNLTLSAGSAGSDSGDGGNVSISAGGVSDAANADGGDITITAGNASTTQGLGGGVTITGGNTFGASTLGGPITLKGGLGSPLTGRGGLVTVEGGDGVDGGGHVEINGGETTGTFNSSMGNVTLQAGQPSGAGGFYEAGSIFIRGGTRFNTTSNQRGGAVTIEAGSTAENNADGPDVTITAGNTNGFNQRHGGDVLVTAGDEEGNGSGTSSGGDIVLTPGTTVSGGVSRAGSVQILGSGTLELLERTASLVDPAGGRGYLWLRDDTPNVLMFTDDDGDDFVIGGTGSGQSLSSVLSVGNTTGGTDLVVSSGDDLAGVDSAVADGAGFTIRGGDFTGGAGNFDGGSLVVSGGDSNGSTNGLRGGDVTVQGGAVTGTAGGATRAGDVFITGGDASGAGGLSDGGNVSVTGGASTDVPGDVTITGGASSGDTGGDVTIRSGEGEANGTGGAVLITTDSGASGNFTYGSITIQTPDANSVNNEVSGTITIQSGQNGTRNVPGTDVMITAGDSFGGGGNRAGDVVITAGDQNNGSFGGDGGDIFLNPGSSANASAGIVDINGDVDISGDCDIGGKLTVTGGIDPIYLGLNEQATFPTTAVAGIGYLWVRNDAPNTLVYTDDGGDDYVVAGSSATASSLQESYEAGNTIVTDTTNGDFDVSGTEAISLDASAASNFTVDGADLTLSTTTSGDVVASAATNVDIDGAGVLIDSTGAFSIDGGDNSNVSTTNSDLTLSTITSGTLALSSAAAVTITPASGQPTTISGLQTSVDRVQHDQGTALVAGDFALSAGWGSTATVSSITGTDSRFLIEVTSAGTGQAANPTITFTYTDGAWPSAPFPQITDNGSVDVSGGYIAPVFELTSRTTTQAVWTLRSSGPGLAYTPVAGDVFKMVVVVVG